MKKLALESEASCSACASLFFSILTFNIFGIICACNVRYKLNVPEQVRANTHGCMKVWYILTQTFFVMDLAIQFALLTIVLGGDYQGLIGVIIPLTLTGVGGFWSTLSSFSAYEKIYMEPKTVKQQRIQMYEVSSMSKPTAMPVMAGNTDGFRVNDGIAYPAFA